MTATPAARFWSFRRGAGALHRTGVPALASGRGPTGTDGSFRSCQTPMNDPRMARHLVHWALLTVASLILWAALGAGLFLLYQVAAA
jgi:hypothetical protein